MTDIYFYNTLTRKKEKFVPINPKEVRMYHCGPTVYFDLHIGNLLSFTFRDVLQRTLEYLGYDVMSVVNITDVGHLVSDDDEGEDKLEKGARREGKTAEEVAGYYIKKIFGNYDAVADKYDWTGELGEMNFEKPSVIAQATKHIPEMIELIKMLEENGYTYVTDLGVYFDVSKFKEYGKLSGQLLEEKLKSVREDLVSDPKKKHPADFALWLFTKGIHEKHQMRWVSPWGEGFPGWHIECSAMSHKYLGNPFDIHTGGKDLIPVHHENETAQTECATGKKVANYWMHNEFNLVDGEKMSKSKGNFYILADIKKKGFDPLALRYLYLTSHYRTPLNFTWESMKAAQTAYSQLVGMAKTWAYRASGESKSVNDKYKELFSNAIADDLNVPEAVGIVWKMVKDEGLSDEERLSSLLEFDKVLGLNLDEATETVNSNEAKAIEELIKRRDQHREKKAWAESDKIRDELLKKGVEIEDTSKGTVWKWTK